MTILLRHFACLAIFSLLAAAPGITGAAAPAASGSEQELEQVMALMAERLSLSDSQAEVLRPRVKDHLDDMRDLFSSYRYGGAGSLPALLQEFDELRDDFRVDLDVVLEDQQMLGLEKLRNEVDESIDETVTNHRLELLRKQLGLNEQQAGAVKPILAQNFREVMRLMSFHTDAVGGGARVQGPLGPEVDNLNKQMEAQLQGVLTKQQMTAYHEWLAEHRDSLRQKEAIGQ